MPIDFRKPQYFKEFRFGSSLVWATIKNIIHIITGTPPLTLNDAVAGSLKSLI